MRPTVEDYCQRCAVCKRSKAPRHKPYGTLSSLPVPEYKWSDLTLDFVEGLLLVGIGTEQYATQSWR